MKYYFLALGTTVFVCVGCAVDSQQIFEKDAYVAPPPAMLQHQGPMVDGPGPAVMSMLAPPTNATQTTQIRFVEPKGMHVGWKVGESYAENQLLAPARYNFTQGATYRLKLTSLPGRKGLVVYPSLQVYPSHPTTNAYLSHNSVPLELTDEDLEQVESNNFVTKVIYLPDPKFQDLAIAGVETLVSTRLDPGVDPVSEADRRGTIMAVLRMGNMDLEMAGQPPLTPKDTARHGRGIQHVSDYRLDGKHGQRVPPMPISGVGVGQPGVPGPMMVSSSKFAAYSPIAGVGGTPTWGGPSSATPIGLPGPAYLPLGSPASLKSHTIRNNTRIRLPKPVSEFLIDVKHSPGIRMPKPVKHVKYTENHPLYRPGQVAYPAWSLPK